MRSRAFWPKSTKTPRRSATFQVVVATSWSPTRRSTSSASAFANLRTSGNGSSGRIGERMCRPVAPEVFGYDARPSSSITSFTTRAISRTNSHGLPSLGSRSISR